MSRRNKSHKDKERKNNLDDAGALFHPDTEASEGPVQSDTPKTKHFDEIIKGFREIEKIEQADAIPVPPTDTDASPVAKTKDSSTSKSYADIIKGFQEIEKIILNSQSSE